MTIPRHEYPRPQFVRTDWLCLNGQWQFEIDVDDNGLEHGMCNRELADTITVPFCPESKLSGVEHKDFMNAVWYRKTVEIPAEWSGKHVLLHFQAVDYDTTVWVNGQEVGRHRGGWCGFTCDLHEVAQPGETATIVVRARDLKSETGKPGGKQCYDTFENHGCFYDRTTGIWQTVWMEPVNTIHLNRPRITPDVANTNFLVTQPITNSRCGTVLKITLKDDKGGVVSVKQPADRDFTPVVELLIPKDRIRLWSPNDPFLYDLEIEVIDSFGTVIDYADSYCGLRSVTIDNKAIKINNQVLFQRQVLDQGYYPDGILTAPSDEALKQDIELALAVGFNSARLHQKVFEERFLYHCDRMGYLVWGEFGDWGIDYTDPKPTVITQWLEVLHRDVSHPCIIGWCGLNETKTELTDTHDLLSDLTRGMFLAAKAMDPTRPVLDVSGYCHRIPQTDVYDSHNYEQDPKTFVRLHRGLSEGKPFMNTGKKGERWSVGYRGQPYFCSEFGGIKWTPELQESHCLKTSWGYGDAPKTLDEFYERFERLCSVLLNNPNMFGYCYTQLTDVFQEQNGLYYFDRRCKFDMQRIKAIQQQPAAVEQIAEQSIRDLF